MMLFPVLLSLLPFLTLASPIAEPNPDPAPAELEPRADKWCTLGATVDENVRCRAGAGTGYDFKRWIIAADPGLPFDRFGVRCKAYGEVIFGNRVWDYIPGWNCWVTAHYTDSECESESKFIPIKWRFWLICNRKCAMVLRN